MLNALVWFKEGLVVLQPDFFSSFLPFQRSHDLWKRLLVNAYVTTLAFAVNGAVVLRASLSVFWASRLNRCEKSGVSMSYTTFGRWFIKQHLLT
ncbi:hypothetical protein AB0758_45370 [Tolypothrix bouteillei VB521301_2]|uniref:hypothetical protein n=1 Tax=Tolypothrix bouteillei TaxID=1246981 RepID=UPI0010FA7D8A